jgi:NAD(P)-dependent dehydrogenase (short-subunit alcohol dehydrogenase family)
MPRNNRRIETRMTTPFIGTAFDLTGKVALVTGAAGLLGVEHSIALAQGGAAVVMTDMNAAALERGSDAVRQATNVQPTAMEMNVCDPVSIRRVKESLERRNLIVTRLVNNAAIDAKVTEGMGMKESSRLEHFDATQWLTEVNVGLTGAILCASIFGPAMANAGDGVILNIASDLSVISPDQRLYRNEGTPETEQPVKPVSYSVIKAGLVGLTRYLATYWANCNVRSNALSPGGVYVSQDDTFVTRLTGLIPLGRMARREEYRGIIQFLCSDAAAYLNGQNIVMDGGRSVL